MATNLGIDDRLIAEARRIRGRRTKRAAGLQGSHADFPVAALAARHALPILTTDRDFEGFARLLPIRPHAPRTAAGKD